MARNDVVTVDMVEHSSTFRRSADGSILHLHRRHNRTHPVTRCDVWGSWWSLAVGNLPPGAVKFRQNKHLIPLEGNAITVIPPFTLVEWHLGTVPFEFDVIFLQKTPAASPPTPSIFRGDVLPDMPDTVEEVETLVASFTEPIEIGLATHPKPMAAATKEFIDRTYRDNIHLANVARDLGFSHSVMTRNFKASYGMSPVTYRTMLRVNDSLPLLLLGQESVSQTARDVGFADVSRYQKNFRGIREASPSTFRFSRS